MTYSPVRRLCLLLPLFVLIGAAGCLPTKVAIDLAPQPMEFKETQVLGDKNAADKVVMIDVQGLIAHEASSGLFVGHSNPVDDLAARLSKAQEDPGVKAVLLRVNSPGGTVAASETMYRLIRSFRERSGKPVVVSMGEMAASGGYYISLAGDRIYAQETTITGSIGVIIQTMNFSKGMAMIGIEGRAITSAKNKDLANPFEPMREGQYAILQGTVNDFYAGFRGLVLARRPAVAAQPAAHIDELTDGRIFTGRHAKEEGLVDDVGGVDEAFASASGLAKLSRAKLVKYHAPGEHPLSPYAQVSMPAEAPRASLGGGSGSGGSQVNMINVEVYNPASLGPGFMYLWNPTGAFDGAAR